MVGMDCLLKTGWKGEYVLFHPNNGGYIGSEGDYNMKRYKRVEFCGVQYNMHEDPDGEWVKYEDVKHLRPNFSVCEYTEEMLGDAQFQISRIMEAYEKEIRELKDRIGNDPKTHLQPGIKMPECNCKEMTKHKPASISRGNLFGDSLLPQSPDYWICPAHGYKKR